MLEQDYISKIKDEKIKKPMLKISNFFEPYIGNDHDDESKILFEKIIFMNIIRGWKK
ncbi:hypothetical protein KQ236_12230 [Lactococcus lactis]|nr:hypothetical protein [Lactococcus lactis]